MGFLGSSVRLNSLRLLGSCTSLIQRAVEHLLFVHLLRRTNAWRFYCSSLEGPNLRDISFSPTHSLLLKQNTLYLAFLVLVWQTEAELLAKGLSKDNFTAAILNGAFPEDGGGSAAPVWIEGNGNCLFNACSAFFAKSGQRGVRSSVRALAAKLRLSVVLKGIKYMEVFLSRQEPFFGAWYNYTAEVREQMSAAGWHVEPDVENGWRVGSHECARLLYLAQLRHIACDGVWVQQFVFPILATVLQAPVRVFVPCETICADATLRCILCGILSA